MVTTWVLWMLDLKRHGDFGIGKSHNVVDGLFGDTSIPTIKEELGLGLIVNQDQTVELFEDFHSEKLYVNDLCLIYRIYVF